MARLLERYRQEIVPELKKQLDITNTMAVPRLDKIVINMGVGKATEEKDRIEAAVADLGLIAGQRPVVTKARQSVAGFKIRKNDRIGCKVTLRGQRMYEFLDRLINVVIPRSRDFRGLTKKSLDDHGNFTMGIPEQVIFPEINIENLKFTQGMDITMVTRCHSKQEAYALLKSLGMPFRD